jgi:Ser/Thr protein kinase RdoA (MazF antagonist)
LHKSFPGTDVAAAVGAAAVGVEPVAGGGYGTNTAKWRIALEDGRRAFVKLALDDAAADWLRAEHRIYTRVRGSFLPALVGWRDAGGRTLLVLEDLGHAHWPPPWSPGMVDAVLAALDAVRTTVPPLGLRALEGERERLHGWAMVADDARPLLATGLCSPSWLDVALPVLAQASATAELEGTALVHLDVRSDNLCLDGDRVVLVDWNFASVGNPLMDVVAWAPSLRLEGGPEPWELVADSRGLAALIAGFFASRAGLPPPATAPTVREFQRRQAEIALPWAARELDLDPRLGA